MTTDADRYDKKAEDDRSREDVIVTDLEERIREHRSYDKRWAGIKLERFIVEEDQQKAWGLRVCEWGCYSGKLAIYLSKKYEAMEVYGVDIAHSALAFGSELNRRLNGSAQFLCNDLSSEKLAVKPGAFDVIVGLGILHHVPTPQAYRNVGSALAEGGVGIFLEPTRLNPFVRLYRHLRREKYSPHERPVDFSTIDDIEAAIPECDISYTAEHFLSPWVMFVLKQVEKVARLVRRQGVGPGFGRDVMRICGQVDDFLLMKVPALRPFCQYFTITIRKSSANGIG
jgi:SAM-dependent methyltransferase